MRAIIVCGGDCPPELLPQRSADTYIIAADSGLKHLQRAGIAPDLVIGDFDSLGYTPEGAEVLPTHKDDTDLIAAARCAISAGAQELVFYGALGGARFSHSLAAVQALGFAAEQGAGASLVDARCTVRVLRGERRYPAGTRGLLSVFALTGAACVTLRGLEYPLERHTLTPLFPLGVSNAFTGAEAVITVHSGTVILVEEPGAT